MKTLKRAEAEEILRAQQFGELVSALETDEIDFNPVLNNAAGRTGNILNGHA
jgi:hypothetical protein